MWYLEGVDDLDEDGAHHKSALYVLLEQMYQSQDYTTVLLTKKYGQICQFCMDLHDSVDAWAKVIEGNKQVYYWEKKYSVVIVGVRAVLVLHPDVAVDAGNMDPSLLWQLAYAERIFAYLLKIHKVDHCKWTTFFTGAKAAYGNVKRNVCKMFTDCCLHCISLLSRK
jgi:hypothetical protein